MPIKIVDYVNEPREMSVYDLYSFAYRAANTRRHLAYLAESSLGEVVIIYEVKGVATAPEILEALEKSLKEQDFGDNLEDTE